MMDTKASFWLELPFFVRVAIALMVLIVLWRIIGKVILWILSIIPLLLERIFILFYYIVELPVTMLHKKLGAGLYKIDNFMTVNGERIDKGLRHWYECWHCKYTFRWKTAFKIFCVCYICIVLPSFLSLENKILKTGEELYIVSEKISIEWLEKYYPRDSEIDNLANNEIQLQNAFADGAKKLCEKIENSSCKIVLVVSGVSSVLLVRDIPDMENSTTLERLHNGDKVDWAGELIFEQAENDHVETWVRVVTQDGVEGWSRLFYLHPENFEKRSFYVTEIK